MGLWCGSTLILIVLLTPRENHMNTVRTISRSGLVRLQQWMQRHGWSYRGLIYGSGLGREHPDAEMEYWTHDRDETGAALPILHPHVDEYPLYATDLFQIACAWIEPWLVENTPNDHEAQQLIERAGNRILEVVEPNKTHRSLWYDGVAFEFIRRHVEHLYQHPRDRQAMKRLRSLVRGYYYTPRWGARKERQIERKRWHAMRREMLKHPQVRNVTRAGRDKKHTRIETSYTMPDGHGIDLWVPHSQWDRLTDFGGTNSEAWIAKEVIRRHGSQAMSHIVSTIGGVRVEGCQLITDIDDDIQAAITRLGEACEYVALKLWNT